VTLETGGACRFGYSAGRETGGFERAFRATPGRWIGAKVGVFATAATETKASGHADFEYFRFSSP